MLYTTLRYNIKLSSDQKWTEFDEIIYKVRPYIKVITSIECCTDLCIFSKNLYVMFLIYDENRRFLSNL